MFWADWGVNAKIERAFMDGTNRSTIINGASMGWPNGLAIDYKSSKLYWVDARLDVMMSANLDGGERKVILRSLRHPFGVDVFDGYVYWSDWLERKLFRAKITNNIAGTRETLLSGVGGLMEIRAYNKELVSGR